MPHHLVEIDLTSGLALPSAEARYDVLVRAHRAARSQGGELLAFGLGVGRLGLVVEGVDHPTRLSRAIKLGVRRRWRCGGSTTESTWVQEVRAEELVDVVHHTHAMAAREGVPVARSLWSSHVDLTGARRASFFDAPRARRHLGLPSPHRSHQLLARHRWRPPLQLLRRVAAAAHGVAPSSRGWQGSFVALALRLGHDSAEAAEELGLSRRRVQQLAARRCSHLGPARALLRRRVVLP